MVASFWGIVVLCALKPDGRIEALIQKGIDFDRLAQNLSRTDEHDAPGSLVREAARFSRYLNPPSGQGPRHPIASSTQSKMSMNRSNQPSRNIRPKFMLLATSVYRSRLSESSALIGEAGAGQRWVRVGDTIGRITVEGIHRGKISYRYQGRSVEMSLVERPLHHDGRPPRMTVVARAPQPTTSPRSHEPKGQVGSESARNPVVTFPLTEPQVPVGNPSNANLISASEFP